MGIHICYHFYMGQQDEEILQAYYLKVKFKVKIMKLSEKFSVTDCQ